MKKEKLDPKNEIAVITKAPIVFSAEDAVIKQMEENYLPMVIDGVKDHKGFKDVHEARMVVANTRVTVDKERKAMKADALEYGRKVDCEAKRIAARLDPIETHLKTEENRVKAEKEELKEAERQRKEKFHQDRVKEIIEAGAVFTGLAFAFGEDHVVNSEVDTLNEDEWVNTLELVQAWKKMEDEKEAAAEAERKADEAKQAAIAEENKRLKEEAEAKQAEQERREKALKAREDKIKADEESAHKKEIERRASILCGVGLMFDGAGFSYKDVYVDHVEQAGMNIEEFNMMVEKISAQMEDIRAEEKEAREKEIEEAKAKAAAEAKAESEAEAKRKADEKLKAEKAEDARLKREEKMKPDKEKLAHFAKAFLELPYPDVKSEEATAILRKVPSLVMNVVTFLRDESEKL